MKTLVIGAGFAGLTAGYTLKQAGVDVTILEARNRIGGRAYTNREFADIPVEFGAELIHGHKVSTWEWVNKLGLRTIHWEKMMDSMVRMEDGRWLTMQEARTTSSEFDVTRTWDLPDIPALDGDEEFGAYLKRIGFTDEQLRYVKRSFANAVGDDMRYISAKAILDEFGDHEQEIGSGDFRILDGYDSIYNALADGLDIRLNTPVKSLRWDGDGIQALTHSNETFSADNAVITLPLGVLKSGKVIFYPGLPVEKQVALSGLHMGPVMKMIYLFDAPLLEEHIGAIYSKLNPPMWWTPSLGREEDTVIWTAFVSGDWARELLVLTEEQAIQKGLESLRTELDQPNLQYIKAEIINWPYDEYAMGGYSVVLPGQFDARAKLAKPTPPLYWGGEASAPHYLAATIHGASYTGKRAAEEILASVNQ